jgi:hypothetical protein
MVVAVIALSVAIGGSAVALDQGDRRQVTKIVKKQIKKRVPGAYAGITASGSVDPNVPSRAITNARVDIAQEGYYCFNLAFAPKAAAATPAVDDGLADDGILSYTLDAGEYIECPPSAEAEVTNIDSDDGFTLQNDAFNVHFFR